MNIKTTNLIRTSQSWDGAPLPDFPQGKPELQVIRLDFPVGAKTGWHHHTVVNYGIMQRSPGGPAHWLFRKQVIKDIQDTLKK